MLVRARHRRDCWEDARRSGRLRPSLGQVVVAKFAEELVHDITGIFVRFRRFLAKGFRPSSLAGLGRQFVSVVQNGADLDLDVICLRWLVQVERSRPDRFRAVGGLAQLLALCLYDGCGSVAGKGSDVLVLGEVRWERLECIKVAEGVHAASRGERQAPRDVALPGVVVSRKSRARRLGEAPAESVLEPGGDGAGGSDGQFLPGNLEQRRSCPSSYRSCRWSR
jgi:hypothetical protein